MNGSDPTENGVDGVGDAEADDEQANSVEVKKSGKDKDGDEEMTVIVPPLKAVMIDGSPGKDNEGDIAMNGIQESENKTHDDTVDPQAKAVDSSCS